MTKVLAKIQRVDENQDCGLFSLANHIGAFQKSISPANIKHTAMISA